jgi:putative DNA primase/helicase
MTQHNGWPVFLLHWSERFGRSYREEELARAGAALRADILGTGVVVASDGGLTLPPTPERGAVTIAVLHGVVPGGALTDSHREAHTTFRFEAASPMTVRSLVDDLLATLNRESPRWRDELVVEIADEENADGDVHDDFHGGAEEAEEVGARGPFERFEQEELEEEPQEGQQAPGQEQERRGRRGRRSGPAPGQRDRGRLLILESPRDLETPLQLAIQALVEQGEVYRRDRQLVVPDRSVMLKTREGDRPHLALRKLDTASLQRYLARAARFVRRNEEGYWVDKEPSLGLCRRLAEYVSDKPMGLPTVNGVWTAPFLRPDLSVCSTPGYDGTTGIFYDPCGRVFPTLPTITPEAAPALSQEAIKILGRPFRGYKTASSTAATLASVRHPLGDVDGWDLRQDLDRAVLIAMLLTLVTAPATRLRPATLVDAPTVGSGKTKAVEVPLIALHRQAPGLIPCDNLDVDPAEVDRMLRAAMLGGAPGIVLDNVRGEAKRIPRFPVLLTGEWNVVRPYHTLDEANIRNVFTFHLSGNNVELGSEIGRRVLMARIDTGEERPDRLAFDFDPCSEAMAHAEEMVVAALTVVHAYIVAGRPKTQGVPFGSFEEWAAVVRDALLWAGLPDIVLSIDEAFFDDSETQSIASALIQLGQVFSIGSRFSAGEVARRCIEREIQRGNGAGDATWDRPEGFGGQAPWRYPELREALGTALQFAQDPKNRSTASLNPIAIGRWLKRIRGKPVGGLKLVRPSLKKGDAIHYYVESKDQKKMLF